MQFEVFINFDGNCREAVEFYAKVFKSTVNNLMTYGDAPADPNYTLNEADKDRIMYAGIPVENMVLMFMDAPSGHPPTFGDNITPTISTGDKDEITRVFNELKKAARSLWSFNKPFLVSGMA